MATKYISPTEVISPKKSWSLITVLVDGGPGEGALALGRWDNKPVLAMRWNGDNDDNPIGNPQSRGCRLGSLFPTITLRRSSGLCLQTGLPWPGTFYPNPNDELT
jgi:hypothetical protein